MNEASDAVAERGVIRRFHAAVNRKLPTVAFIRKLLVLTAAICIARCQPVLRFYARHAPVWGAHAYVQPQSEFATRVVAGARAQIGTTYDSGYIQISYPGGDVPSDRGACSDVVIRALRKAGADLQQLIHEDMLRAPDQYPRLNSSLHPDPNIDHRRCLNQMRFFSRHSQMLTTGVSAETRDEWQPGDFVYWRQPGNRWHVGVLSDRTNGLGLPLVIHNGSVCIEQDCLTDWEIAGHYRYSPE